MPSAQKRTHHPLIDIDIRRLLVLKQGPFLIMLLFKPPSYIHLFLLPDARETQPVGSQALLGLGLGSCGGDRFIRGTPTSPQSSSAASRTPSPADSVSLRSGCAPAAVRRRPRCGLSAETPGRGRGARGLRCAWVRPRSSLEGLTGDCRETGAHLTKSSCQDQGSPAKKK